MTKAIKLSTVLVLGFAFLLAYSPALSSDLIKPTRQLDSTGEKLGKLSVFSEPPGLEITLEGKIIGKTPLFLDEVKPGIYRLRVKNSKADINIEPGKTLKISLYKDEFILIPATDKKAPKQPETVETNVSPLEPAPSPPAEQRPKELSPIERYQLLGHF